MWSGVRFNTLEKGDSLIDKNWSYKNLWGLYAAKQKLKDQFEYAKDIGFNIIYDRLTPIRNSNGELTLNGVGDCSNIWPLYDPINHDDRINFYKNNIYGSFKFICELEFPEPLNEENEQEYYDFFIKLLDNRDFNWIENWQIFNTPEELVINSKTGELEAKIQPQIYVRFLNKIRTYAKLLNTNINIGGPGIFKILGTLIPTNYLNNDNSFDHKWLDIAINEGLLSNIDFFSVQLKQHIKGLDYDEISDLSLALNDLINSKINKSLPIYSINQGRQVINNTQENLQDQAYFNVSEMLNSAKNNIIPIINSMVDVCNNTELLPNYIPNIKEEGFGICKYDMTKKPQYEVLKFILKELSEFNILSNPNKLYNDIENCIDNITFINSNNEDVISIVWAKHKQNKQVVLLPNTDEWYYLIDGTKNKIISPFEFSTYNPENKSHDFIIVTQHLNLTLIDYEDIEQNVFKKYIYNNNLKNNLLDSIPYNYNIDTDHTNFYKILRSMAYELSDVRIQIDALNDNTYLQTAQKDAIYKNFGTLVNLEKQSDWDYEKYKKLIQGVIKSLLTGPTVPSVEEAINLFINYDSIYNNNEKVTNIKIHELYKGYDLLDPSIYNNINPQYAFVVEVNKNIDIPVDQEILNRDLKYIVNILKPAHTLSFIVIILSGTEDYKKWYYQNHIGKNGLPIEFKDSDESNIELSIGDYENNKGKKEGVFGWKHQKYNGAFRTYNPKKPSINSHLNGAALIGPRYTLYDKAYSELTIKENEDINIYENTKIEISPIIRYGYYNNEHDRNDKLDPKRDNQIEKDYIKNEDKTYINPDYYNPDSGEYYKNWWMKYHKLKKDDLNEINNSGVNIIENKKFKFELENDTSKPITELEIVKKIYPEKEYYTKKLPIIFKTTESIIYNEYEKNNYRLAGTVSNDIPRKEINYAIKCFTAPIGFSKIPKNDLPIEIKPWESYIKINSNNELELGSLPYNNINHRLYLANAYPYDRNDKNLYFEDMDLSPNYTMDYTRYYYNNNGEIIQNKGAEYYSSSNEDWHENIVDETEKVDLDIKDKIPELKQELKTKYNFNNSKYDIKIDTFKEFKFGYYRNIFTLNKNILKVDNLDLNNDYRLGFGCSLKDESTYNLEINSNEIYKNIYALPTDLNIKLFESYSNIINDKLFNHLDKSLNDEYNFIINDVQNSNSELLNKEKINIIKNEDRSMDISNKLNDEYLVKNINEYISKKMDKSLNEEYKFNNDIHSSNSKLSNNEKINIIKNENKSMDISNKLSDKYLVENINESFSKKMDKSLNEEYKFNNDIHNSNLELLNNETIKKATDSLIFDIEKDKNNENYHNINDNLESGLSSNENYKIKETIYSMFRLNMSKTNDVNTTLLNNNNMSTNMEMYKIINGVKLIVKNTTVII